MRLLDRNINLTIVSKWPDAAWVWKHTMPPPPTLAAQRPILVVTITKNPYSWLRSLWRVPYEYVGPVPRNFSAFLRAPWAKLPGGREHWKLPAFTSPVHLWSVKNRAYTEIGVPHLVNLRYESLVAQAPPAASNRHIPSPLSPPALSRPLAAQPEAEVLRLALRLGAPCKQRGFVNVVEAKSWEARNTRRTFAEHQRYYGQEQWKSSYIGDRSTADLRYIGKHVDREMMARFSYKLLRKCIYAPRFGSNQPRRPLCKEDFASRAAIGWPLMARSDEHPLGKLHAGSTSRYQRPAGSGKASHRG